jgi:hypothetical protein
VRLEITPSNKELQEALKSISIYDAKSRLRIEAAVEKSVKEMARLAKSRVPVESGALRKSVFSSFHKIGCVGYFGAKAPHAHLVEFGVKAVTVKPKKKKWLRFNDGYTYTKWSNLPARRGRPFVRPSYEQERPELIREIKKAVQPK